MLVTLASRPSPNPTAKADFAAATPSIAVVLDGVSVPPGVETGCVHDAHWYVRRLGIALLDTFSQESDRTPIDNLVQAMANVSAWHINVCDLRLPSPSSAVAILREQEEEVEFLLLGDTTVLLDEPTGVRAIVDRPLDKVAGAEEAASKRSREQVAKGGDLPDFTEINGRPDGFWRVSINPDVVEYAVTGSTPRRGLRRAALLSDGAARLAKPFGLMDWPAFLDSLDNRGPEELIDRLREVERSDPHRQRWPRNDTHDDASVLVCRFRDDSHTAAYDAR